MTLQEIVTFSKLSYYDGKLKAWVNGLLAGKADKVSNATSGNFAGLDENGNLTDSDSKASDFKTVQTAVVDPTASGTGLTFIDSISQNANGEITPTKKTVQSASATQDGLMSSGDYSKLAALPTNAALEEDLAAKADKVSGATNGNFAGLDSNGNLTDSGSKAADFATATQGGYADSALQSVAKGTDGTYVTTTVGEKTGNNGAKSQTIAVGVTIQSVASAGASAKGLAEASDVKDYIDTKVAAGINYKGSVQNYSALPASPNVGDMYNVKEDEGTPGTAGFHPGDMNYIWAAANGDDPTAEGYVAAHWDAQAPIIVVTECTTAQIDSLFPAA